jgi:pimeloyl-ACP methyl ester carboxylesterase
VARARGAFNRPPLDKCGRRGDVAGGARRAPERLEAFHADYVKVAPGGAQHWPIFAAKSWKLWLTPVVIEPAELSAIKAPVLVIAGDHDLTQPEETLEIYRGLALGQLMILPATGHDTFGERAEIVNAAIRTFLDPPGSEKRAP